MKNLSSEDIDMMNALLAGLVRSSRYYNDPNVKRKEKSIKQVKEEVLSSILTDFAKNASANSQATPSDRDLRRMYDVVQADANLTKRIAGLGFGNTGDAYRKAAIKLHILAIMNVLRDGKNIRNDIVHKPGFIPSESSTTRALQEYELANKGISDFLNSKA